MRSPRFHDIYDKNQFEDALIMKYYLNEVERCHIRSGSKAIYKINMHTIIKFKSSKDNNYFYYYIEPINGNGRITVVCEKIYMYNMMMEIIVRLATN